MMTDYTPVQILGRNPLGGVIIYQHGKISTVPPSWLEGKYTYQYQEYGAPYPTGVATKIDTGAVAQPLVTSDIKTPTREEEIKQITEEGKKTIEASKAAERPATRMSYALYHPTESLMALGAYTISPLLGVKREKIVATEREKIKGFAKETKQYGLFGHSLYAGIEYGALTFPYGKVASSISGKIISPTLRLGLKSVGLGAGLGITTIGASKIGAGIQEAKATGEAKPVYDVMTGVGLVGIGSAITRSIWKMPVKPQKIETEFVALSKERIEAKGTISKMEGYSTSKGEVKPYETVLRKEEIFKMFKEGKTTKETSTMIIKEWEGFKGYFLKQSSKLPKIESELVDIAGKQQIHFGKFEGFDVYIERAAGFPISPATEEGFKITVGIPSEGTTKTPLSDTFEGITTQLKSAVKIVMPAETAPSRITGLGITKSIFRQKQAGVAITIPKTSVKQETTTMFKPVERIRGAVNVKTPLKKAEGKIGVIEISLPKFNIKKAIAPAQTFKSAERIFEPTKTMGEVSRPTKKIIKQPTAAPVLIMPKTFGGKSMVRNIAGGYRRNIKYRPSIGGLYLKKFAKKPVSRMTGGFGIRPMLRSGKKRKRLF